VLGRKLKQFLNAIKLKLKKEKAMPMGKGTYGSKKGRPPKAAIKKISLPSKKKVVKKKK